MEIYLPQSSEWTPELAFDMCEALMDAYVAGSNLKDPRNIRSHHDLVRKFKEPEAKAEGD